MGSKGGGDVGEIRFAPYIEEHHGHFLNIMRDHRAVAIDDSPYTDYDEIEIEAAFFGTGYMLSSFPSLWDMYGKFMAGFDVEVLFDQIFADVIDGTVIDNLISAEAQDLEDELTDNAIPRYETGMRDINSVISSSFAVGKAMMESTRIKAISKFSAKIRYWLIPVVADRWKTHLEWNKAVVTTYAEMFKFYLISRIDVDNQNFDIAAKDRLWPFTVLRYEGEGLGALTGAKNIKDPAAASTGQKMLGGALSGAAAGAMVGSVVPVVGTAWGAVIGGVLGAASGMM